ncbi:clp protease adapter protein ClpF, chloroplastic [Selaginella moellendorffii]|nr:clp protease adapter protein ClpF, chloroplastic [Selaginella moellendorffii]XP_024539241.1 clp protease adapter protein ClpF, chloroplastic [Selaginella moellendorffii]|eukprot:XP_002978497.2 clp protease adapter protein ClpF, chloroplastic [Selaginella moellendorffii]
MLEAWIDSGNLMARALPPNGGVLSSSRLPIPKQLFAAPSILFTRASVRFSSPKFVVAAAQPRGGDDKSSASSSSSSTSLSPKDEYSESVNEELLYFLFQLDLATRLQRALNQDHYDAAQAIREKISQVEKEVSKLREKKAGAVSAKNEAQDKEIALLRFRSELSASIEREDYEGARQLKDKISKLESESLAASVRALAYQNVKYAFRLGQKVRHKLFGYRGVVCGMDPVCCESEKWCDRARVYDQRKNQPFYQVLVDVESEPQQEAAYVAEDSLEAPAEPDMEALDHPYIYFLFFGMDSAGDYIPTKQLRQKYDVARHEQTNDA